jgi:membrane-associated protease RseP (regulator of RpoE activity)
MFDIGVAGPLAGFVACIALLTYGFLNLPGPEYLLAIHPNYDFAIGGDPNSQGLPLEFGQTILFASLRSFFTDSQQFVPPMTEIYHYPFLCVGWFGLFVTAMNLIPIGQFDGGHLIYTMFGERHRTHGLRSSDFWYLASPPSLMHCSVGLFNRSRAMPFHRSFRLQNIAGADGSFGP